MNALCIVTVAIVEAAFLCEGKVLSLLMVNIYLHNKNEISRYIIENKYINFILFPALSLCHYFLISSNICIKTNFYYVT